MSFRWVLLFLFLGLTLGTHVIRASTSAFVIDQSSMPVKLPSGTIDQHNSTTFQFNINGAEGGITEDMLIATPTGEFLTQITARPLRIPMSMQYAYAVSPHTMLIQTHVGTTQLASLGVVPPTSLSGPTDYDNSNTHLTPSRRRLMQITGSTIGSNVASIYSNGPSPSSDRFGANIWNPPGFQDVFDGRECNLAVQIAVSIVSSFPYPHPGNGFGATPGYLCGPNPSSNDQPVLGANTGPGPLCGPAKDGNHYYTFGVPCTLSLKNTDNGLAAMSDPKIMSCIGGMWQEWTREIGLYGANCLAWPRQSLLPNTTKWCDANQADPERWVQSALAFRFGDPNDDQNPNGWPWVEISFGVSGPMCNLTETTYPVTPLEIYSPPISLTTNVNSLCSIDPLKYTTFANAFTGQSSRICAQADVDANQAACTAYTTANNACGGSIFCSFTVPMQPACCTVGELATPFSGASGLDINPMNSDGIFYYYDSTDCPCMPSDNPYHYTCPTNPWIADINLQALGPNALNGDSLFFRVGTLQKCSPLQLTTGAGWGTGPGGSGDPINGGSPAQLNARAQALSQGGYCVPFISDAIAFDYSVVVSETFRPPFPEGCWPYVAELIAVDVAVLIVAGPAYAAAIVGYCILAHLPFSSLPGCDCPLVTVTAGSFQANHELAVGADVTTDTTLLRQTQGLLTQNANIAGNLTSSTVPALLNASNAINNEALIAQLTAAKINQQEVLVQTDDILVNHSIAQLQQSNTQMIAQQTSFLSGLNAAVNATNYQMSLISSSAAAFSNFSTSVIQQQLAATTSGIQQYMLLAKNDETALDQLHEVIGVMNKEVLQQDIFFRMMDDLVSNVPLAVANYGLVPLLSDCNDGFICGTPRSKVDPLQNITIDSIWTYALEWQYNGANPDTPSNPLFNSQTPRIHQWNYVMICNMSVLVNYFNVTIDIGQLRDMIRPGSCSIKTVHTSCLSNQVLGSLLTYIESSNGDPTIFGFPTPMVQGENAVVHRCAANTFITHESNTSQWSYQWDASLTTECAWPNLITFPGSWAGYLLYRGGTFGLKVSVPYASQNCLLDDFSRTLYMTETGYNPITSLHFGYFDFMFTTTIGSQAVLRKIGALNGFLPRYGLEQLFLPVYSPYNASAFRAASPPPTSNYSALAAAVYGSSVNATFLDQIIAALTSQENYGFSKDMSYDFMVMAPKGIPAILITPNDTIAPEVDIQIAKVNNSFSLDLAYANLQFFANNTFAQLGTVIDQTKLYSTFAAQQMWFFYPSWIFDRRGAPSVYNLNMPEKRQSYIYDVDPNDVTPYARTWLLSEGKLDYIRKSIGKELFERILNGSVALQLQNAAWISNVTVIPDWGQSLLKHLNYSGQSWDNMIPFDADIEMLLFNEAFNRQITVTNQNVDLLDFLVEWSPRLASVSLHEHYTPMSCTDFIPPAPFDDWILISCTCLKPQELYKQTCTIMQNFYFTAPVAWLYDHGGETADAWTQFYLQPVNQTFQVQVVLPQSVVLGVAAGQNACPSNIGKNTTSFVFDRPNFGQNVTLEFNMTLATINYVNASGDSFADCQQFVTGTLNTAGWTSIYDSFTNTWVAMIKILYPAHLAISDIQPTQALPIPLSTSSCQLLKMQIARADPPYTFCGSWDSTGITAVGLSSDSLGFALGTNIVQSVQFVNTFSAQTTLSSIQASLQTMLQSVVGPVDITQDVLANFLTPNQFSDLLGNLPSSSLDNFVGTNGTLLTTGNETITGTGGIVGSYPLGVVYVINSTSANNTFVKLYPPKNTTSLNGVSDAGAAGIDSVSQNFNISWSTLDPSQLAAGTGASQVADQLAQQLEAQTANQANFSITPSALANFLSALKNSVVFNSLQPYITSWEHQLAQFNLSAAATNAMSDPIWKTVDSLKCMNDWAIQQQQYPNWDSTVTQNVIDSYNYGTNDNAMTDADHTVNANPGSYLNGIQNDDAKQAVGWILTAVVVVIVVFAIGACGMFCPGAQEGSCFCGSWCLANYSYEMYGPGKPVGCWAKRDQPPPSQRWKMKRKGSTSNLASDKEPLLKADTKGIASRYTTSYDSHYAHFDEEIPVYRSQEAVERQGLFMQEDMNPFM